LLFVLLRRGGIKNRREMAVQLHKAQLEELARDVAQARIGAADYEGARLEVERRLLAADALHDPATDGNAKWLLACTAVLVPVMAFMLYLPGSTPNVPSEPHTQWLAKQQQAQAQIVGIIAQLRAKLATLDPNSVQASEGQTYLAEALAEQAGQITPEALALFKQSLVNAPPDAPWRGLAEHRVAQAQGQAGQ
ncbi:MAG: c-type cytochrome biogenesis protein CcmI, partial [Acidocella sp.]|nr:c-type cytochrome biogenesis protein CcmI [Acidocella sp.]